MTHIELYQLYRALYAAMAAVAAAMVFLTIWQFAYYASMGYIVISLAIKAIVWTITMLFSIETVSVYNRILKTIKFA